MSKPSDRLTKRTAGRSKSNGFRYIRCSVEPGMFRNEFLVLADAVDPDDGEKIQVQLLVGDHLVKNVHGTPQRGKPVEGRLRVGLVRVSRGLAVVALPQPGIPVGDSMVIREEALMD